MVSELAFGVADGEADPIDHQGVLALAQRRCGEPAIAMGQLFAAFLTRDRDLVERRAVDEVVERLVGLGLAVNRKSPPLESGAASAIGWQAKRSSPR